MTELREKTGKADIDQLRVQLDEECSQALENINDIIIPEGKETAIYQDCVAKIREQDLKRQEEEIITKLSMADEEENHDEIIRLTQQLIEIQKRIKT